MLISEYYARLDGSLPLTALELVEPDVRFLIVVPGDEFGGGYDELHDYITGRPTDVERLHHVLRRGTDEDVEFAHGQVSQYGAPVGSFTALGRVSGNGRLSHYQAFFRPDFAMLPAVS